MELTVHYNNGNINDTMVVDVSPNAVVDAGSQVRKTDFFKRYRLKLINPKQPALKYAVVNNLARHSAEDTFN